jgi:hypothetical protein
VFYRDSLAAPSPWRRQEEVLQVSPRLILPLRWTALRILSNWVPLRRAEASCEPARQLAGNEQGLDRLPHVGIWVDPSGLDPQNVVDLLLDRQAEAVWKVEAGANRGH